jgi:hypothetical protein
MAVLPSELLNLVRRAGMLGLNVDDPGWDDARGYLFDESNATLYFPVSKKYLPEDLNDFRVLIRSEPRVLVIGDLLPATSDDDFTIQLALALKSSMEEEKARYMLLDQRTKRPRRSRCKLVIRELSAIDP